MPALAAADHVYGNVAGHPAKMGTLVGPGSGCAAMYDDQILEPGSDDDYETIDEVTAAALEPTLDDVYDDPSALGEPPAQESVYADARAAPPPDPTVTEDGEHVYGNEAGPRGSTPPAAGAGSRDGDGGADGGDAGAENDDDDGVIERPTGPDVDGSVSASEPGRSDGDPDGATHNPDLYSDNTPFARHRPMCDALDNEVELYRSEAGPAVSVQSAAAPATLNHPVPKAVGPSTVTASTNPFAALVPPGPVPASPTDDDDDDRLYGQAGPTDGGGDGGGVTTSAAEGAHVYGNVTGHGPGDGVGDGDGGAGDGTGATDRRRQTAPVHDSAPAEPGAQEDPHDPVYGNEAGPMTHPRPWSEPVVSTPRAAMSTGTAMYGNSAMVEAEKETFVDLGVMDEEGVYAEIDDESVYESVLDDGGNDSSVYASVLDDGGNGSVAGASADTLPAQEGRYADEGLYEEPVPLLPGEGGLLPGEGGDGVDVSEYASISSITEVSPTSHVLLDSESGHRATCLSLSLGRTQMVGSCWGLLGAVATIAALRVPSGWGFLLAGVATLRPLGLDAGWTEEKGDPA